MTDPPPRGKRPANRRELIRDAATELFASRGFEYVSMSDIADAVAVRPSALYRHFPGKEQLLGEIFARGVADIGAALTRLDLRQGLDGLAELAGFAIDNRAINALIRREMPHLPAAEHRAQATAMSQVAAVLAERIGRYRVALRPQETIVLAWAVVSVLASPAFHHVEVARAEHSCQLAAAARQVITAQLDGLGAAGGAALPRPRALLLPINRREALLARAVALFAERSYARVSIEDIAAACGMAGPSVYNYFAKKSDILLAALNRGSAYLAMQVSDGLAFADDPAEALRALIGSYLRFAFEHPALIDLLISEVPSLPPAEQEAMRAAQRDYVAELVHLYGQAHPEASPVAARIRVNAVLTIANDLARTGRLREQRGIVARVTAVCEQALELP
ncbi:MAG: TetR/AcrR family transcriptional regulator [Actinomycetia bacterium]|nr:TetR/AcrR family transcriptional regulator [Actinomycetes bacterium]